VSLPSKKLAGSRPAARCGGPFQCGCLVDGGEKDATGTKVVQVPVTLSVSSGKTITVRYAPVIQPGGWATFPDDFDAPTGTLTFLPGQTSKTIPLTVKWRCAGRT
jgi:hypothetical protein